MSSIIKYTSGTIQRVDETYLTLILYNDGERVYSATITDYEACVILDSTDKIKLIPSR